MTLQYVRDKLAFRVAKVSCLKLVSNVLVSPRVTMFWEIHRALSHRYAARVHVA